MLNGPTVPSDMCHHTVHEARDRKTTTVSITKEGPTTSTKTHHVGTDANQVGTEADHVC
jgi:hypothetical protein